jgi:hypothetical protein
MSRPHKFVSSILTRDHDVEDVNIEAVTIKQTCLKAAAAAIRLYKINDM